MGIDPSIDITTEQRKTILSLLERHLPDTEAWVYGSRAKWTSRPQSDLDMVVFAQPGQGHAVSDLREAFEESDLPFRVDLFVWNEVPDSFRKRIEQEHVVLVEPPVRVKNWSKVSLGECIIVNEATYSPKEAWPFVNYLDTGSIKDNRIDAFQHLELSEAKLPSRARRKVEPGDIVFSTVRPNQRHFGLLRDVPENFLASTGFTVFRALEGIADTGFVYWFLTQDRIVDRLHTIAEHSTSAYPSIRPSDIKGLDIDLPPLPEQRAIAHILGTLDDKIELNRRMNRTLEAMARSLFKSWFVDFDPVRAKMALKQHTAPEHHSPLEGESASQGREPAGAPVGGSPGPHTLTAVNPHIAAINDSPLEGESASQGREPAGAPVGGSIVRQYSQQTLQRAQVLRKNQTDAEGLLWHYLRAKQLGGYKFRRQQPIGSYIVDFACVPQKLLIELDGGQHAEQHVYDRERDAFLRAQGYTVLRFWNDEVYDNCFGVLEKIYEVLSAALPDPTSEHHSPLEGESASQGREPAGAPVGGNVSATPGGGDWTVERARAYLDSMDEAIAALFPDRLVNSELGEIPEGWEVGYVEDGFEIVMGQSPPGHTYNDAGDGLPFFQGCSDFGFRYPKNRKFCMAPNRIAQPWDTIVSVRAPVGDINMAWQRCCIGRGVAALRPRSGAVSYGYCVAQRLQIHMREYEHTGTVFGSINRKQLARLPLLQPTPDVIRRFEDYVHPKDQMIRSRMAEVVTLTALRDALLPKLISGEIRLREIQMTLEN